MVQILTIDGPASSGKSTVARLIARHLGFLHLNSGLLYRYSGYLALKNNVSLEDPNGICQLLEGKKLNFRKGPEGEILFFVEGKVFPEDLSKPEYSEAASKVAVHAELRKVLTDLQRRIVADSTDSFPGAVLEGRDAGTVVFSDAKHKFYLNASLSIRARRRTLERMASPGGEPVDEAGSGYIELLAEVSKDLAERDLLDSTREASPNRVAKDAVVIDTSTLGVDEVIKRILVDVQPQVLVESAPEKR